MIQQLTRCAWAGEDPLYIAYHDQEWGLPVHDDRELFEFLLLEGAQAGLSWITILRKRQAYQEAFDGFDPQIVAGYDETKIAQLMNDARIVRNKRKINSAVKNAEAFLHIQYEYGSFDRYIWDFVDGKPIQNAWQDMASIPAKTPLSETIGKDLKKRGFSFVGPTIVYAYMQAAGLVNDHVAGCHCYAPARKAAAKAPRT